MLQCLLHARHCASWLTSLLPHSQCCQTCVRHGPFKNPLLLFTCLSESIKDMNREKKKKEDTDFLRQTSCTK